MPLSQLHQLLIHASVNYRSWEFPYVTSQISQTGVDWIGLENQKEYGLQSWRFFQSGQFAAVTGLTEDWGDKLTTLLANGNTGMLATCNDGFIVIIVVMQDIFRKNPPFRA